MMIVTVEISYSSQYTLLSSSVTSESVTDLLASYYLFLAPRQLPFLTFSLSDWDRTMSLRGASLNAVC
jgi:hypothetical protein